MSSLALMVATLAAACGTGGRAEPDELGSFVEENPGVALALPVNVDVEVSSIGSVLRDSSGRVTAVEAWLVLPGNDLASAQRYCFAQEGVAAEDLTDDCPSELLVAEGVRVFAEPRGDHSILEQAEWARIAS